MKTRNVAMNSWPKVAPLAPIPIALLSASYDLASVAEHLCLPRSYHKFWLDQQDLHPLWSQYLRESDFGNAEVNRRAMLSSEALAFIGGPHRFRDWLGKKDNRLVAHLTDFRHPYLLEYHSMLLEYSFKGHILSRPKHNITPETPSSCGTLAW